MKKVVLYIFAFNLLGLASYAGKEGNGGDEMALEFTSLGGMFEMTMNLQGQQIAPDLDLVTLNEAISNTKVVFVSQVYVGGIEKVAVNYSPFTKENFQRYPELRGHEDLIGRNVILGNRRLWKGLENGGRARKLAIVAHEYLGIIGVEKNDYNISHILNRRVRYSNRHDTYYSDPCPQDPVWTHDGFAAIVNGVFPNGNVSIRVGNQNYNYHRTKVATVGCSLGACSGDTVWTHDGFTAVVNGVFPSGNVSIRIGNQNYNYHRTKIATKGCSMGACSGNSVWTHDGFTAIVNGVFLDGNVSTQIGNRNYNYHRTKISVEECASDPHGC